MTSGMPPSGPGAVAPVPGRPGEPGRLPANPWNEHAWIVGEPVIGEGTWIGAFTVLDGSGGLTIGAGCDVSSGVQIYTHSTARRCVSGRRYPEVDRSPVVIGDRVHLGAGAIVQMGVTIGDEAVVAAGAVVTADVAPRTMVAGIPARVVARIELDPATGHPSFVRD
jgi:acetyltransferase-like isoleucine patch superfamily enzyme